MKRPILGHGDKVTLGKIWQVARLGRSSTFMERKRAYDYLVPRLSWCLIVLALVAHYNLAMGTCSVTFARGGATVTIIAAMAAAMSDWHAPSGMSLSGGPVPRFQLFEPKLTVAIQVVLGTLVWGFGDLAPYLSKACS